MTAHVLMRVWARPLPERDRLRGKGQAKRDVGGDCPAVASPGCFKVSWEVTERIKDLK
jgi:hypothetical protein